MPVRYLSVCSGIEAATVAWSCLGWKPLAFSEIEPFPRAVLAHHYPDVPCHGDFTLLRDQHWIIGADVLVGGTPCQAFSVAGLRNSLSDERGNLSLEFVRLGDAIDDLRLSAGGPPCVIVWENVPGVLSVRDNAFGCFLAALAGAEAPLVPPRGKWTNAGLVAGPKRQVAWRILDAQYFGVAQRRRRLFVVASAGAGFDPSQVLLVEQGLRRDTPPRRQAGKDAAAGAGGGVAVGFQSSQSGVRLTETHATLDANNGPRRHNGVIVPSGSGSLSHWDGAEHPHPTLNQSASSSGGVGASNQELFSQRGAYLVPSTGDVSHCLNAGGMGRQDYETETLIAHTLRANGFDASEDGTGRGTPLVPVAYRTTGNDGAYETGDIVHALTTATDPNSHVMRVAMAVRRLTPVECERLQGFPDGYTNVPWRKQPTAPDGPRYKALGNSMAVPVMAWIGRRIAGGLGGSRG